MPKLPNYRRVKIHRSYTVEEIARLYGIHKNTVRAWVKAGLPICDDKRPMLILGSALAAYLQARRTKNKRPCKSGEFYCVRCRLPRVPAGGMVDYTPESATNGRLEAICPVCDCIMNRWISLAKWEQTCARIEATITEALEQVSDSTQPVVNNDFKEGVLDDAKTQPGE
jgi:predicted transcriptional regulator